MDVVTAILGFLWNEKIVSYKEEDPKYYILRINYVVKPICEFYFVTILVHVKETLSGIKKSWNFVVHSMLTW